MFLAITGRTMEQLMGMKDTDCEKCEFVGDKYYDRGCVVYSRRRKSCSMYNFKDYSSE